MRVDLTVLKNSVTLKEIKEQLNETALNGFELSYPNSALISANPILLAKISFIKK
ncbi:MAG: hypothetical protein ACFFA7_14120 [Promethearchaeota archaeon]